MCCGADRAPPARRFAGKPAPTFVSGQYRLCQTRATALFVRLDIEACAKAFARKCHRHNWPETNVGAGLPAKRRAGGARFHRRSRYDDKHIAVIVSLKGKEKNDRGDRHKPAARFHGKCSGTSRG
ncbi:hypothetical protein CIK02_11605 [Pseudomonas putida]|nr:hypothetical protein DK184_11860 [Pseudomonas sp. RW405]RIZ40275.1 hypothetical protein CIK02_11605 [Pseudomonas putida]